MKRGIALLAAVLLMLPLPAWCESRVINLIENPQAEWSLDESTSLLEVIYPNIYSTDACILRVGDQVMMVDGSKDDQARSRVNPCLAYLGIDHIQTAFNTHPHYDHLTGFEEIIRQASIDELLVAFPDNFNWVIKRTERVLKASGTTVRHVQDGDLLTLGPVEMTVIQRIHSDYPDNDRSACLMLVYGDCRLFMTGDIENRAQRALYTEPPEISLKCDILKYPHHGHVGIDPKLFDILDPELCIVTAHDYPARRGMRFLKQVNCPALSTWYGVIRLRCDGHVWVVDYLYQTGEA